MRADLQRHNHSFAREVRRTTQLGIRVTPLVDPGVYHNSAIWNCVLPYHNSAIWNCVLPGRGSSAARPKPAAGEEPKNLWRANGAAHL